MPNCTAWTFLTGADECVNLSILVVYPQISAFTHLCGVSTQGRVRAPLGEAQRMVYDGESLLSGKQPPFATDSNATAPCNTVSTEQS